jgi:2-polyprenyl-3-methyl-5-hydroxy-6-metoxy-1,4-benzoquinol methylase
MAQETVTSLKRRNDELEFDGERFVPGAAVEISYHHWLRYFFALQFAADKRVLDVASGEGYGAAYLASRAAHVDGFDASSDAVNHALRAYGQDPRLSFTQADIETFFRDAAPESYDLVTAFEVIEHVDERSQRTLLDGIRKTLRPGGVALISTPDKQLYSDVRLQKNPFHVREMYRQEFQALLESAFPVVRIFEQLTYTGSAVFESGASRADLCEMAWTDLLRLKGRCQAGIKGGGEYLVAVVAKDTLPVEPQSTVMLDRARKLIGEEVYAKQVELDQRRQNEQHLSAVVADLQKQIAEIRSVWLDPEEAARRDALHNALIDRLMTMLARQAQYSGTQTDAAYRQMYLDAQRQLTELQSMVSMRVIQRAKAVWDRVPVLKNLVKAVVKKVV